jgi:hypothetical protein
VFFLNVITSSAAVKLEREKCSLVELQYTGRLNDMYLLAQLESFIVLVVGSTRSTTIIAKTFLSVQ